MEILSGVFEGQAPPGTPICLLIRNTDQRSKDYGNIVETFRPGHADYTYWHKYGIRDHRGGGRSSARADRPVRGGGAVAQEMAARAVRHRHPRLHVASSARCKSPFQDWSTCPSNPFFAPNAGHRAANSEAYMDALRKRRRLRRRAHRRGGQRRAGGPGRAAVYDKLDADIAHAMMGINAVKGVEIGAGFASVAQRAAPSHGDELTAARASRSNNAGGVLGGISTGQDITVSIRASSRRPASARRAESIDKGRREPTVETIGRHDPCVGIRATPIAEAMLALVLMDHALRHRAQCGDVRGDAAHCGAAADQTPDQSSLGAPPLTPPGARLRAGVDRPGHLSSLRAVLSRLLRLCRRHLAVRQPVLLGPWLLAGADRRADGVLPVEPHRRPLPLGLAVRCPPYACGCCGWPLSRVAGLPDGARRAQLWRHDGDDDRGST